MTDTGKEAQTAPDLRKQAAADWVADTLGLGDLALEPVSGDASFRRYFRFYSEGSPVILMDAPPEKEDSVPFIDIAHRLESAGLNTPSILRFDLEKGFGLLEDFGDTLYRELISEESVDRLFPGLFEVLAVMARQVDTTGLPDYSRQALATELDLF